MWQALPQLRAVSLRANAIELGDMHLPKLCSFELDSRELLAKQAHSLEMAHWPLLESLKICLGDQVTHELGKGDASHLQGLLNVSTTPALRHIAIQCTNFGDALLVLMANSTILSQLETLDLSFGTISQRGAQAILEHPEAFSKLKKLDLSNNLIPAELHLPLEGINENLLIGRQWRSEEQRYEDLWE
jgi:hypothetical protein